MLIKLFLILMLFVTAWIILGIVSRHIGRGKVVAVSGRDRIAPALALPAGPQPADRGPCCREVPCSDACARAQQEMQDRLAERYDLVAAAALEAVTAQVAGAAAEGS